MKKVSDSLSPLLNVGEQFSPILIGYTPRRTGLLSSSGAFELVQTLPGTEIINV